MGETLRLFFRGLFYEGDTPSWTRVVSGILLLAFLIGSFYLLFRNQTWSHYSDFAAATGGGGAGLQAFNKFINSTRNSLPGQFPDKGGNVS